jgi:hypothetical protein
MWVCWVAGNSVLGRTCGRLLRSQGEADRNPITARAVPYPASVSSTALSRGLPRSDSVQLDCIRHARSTQQNTPGWPTPPVPAPPKRPRAKAPKACAGVTHKPHGALGERGTAPLSPPWSCAARSHAAHAPTASSRGPLAALLAPHRGCLSGRAGAAQPAGQGASQGWSLATGALPRVRRLFSRASRHDCSWPGGRRGAECMRVGVPGRRTGQAGPRAGL